MVKMHTLYVTPGKETYRTLSVNPDDYQWKDTRLEFSQSFKRGFDIRYSNDHPEHDIIIRPSEMYLSHDFESIFGLGYGCRGFNRDIVVAVMNHDNKGTQDYGGVW
jgi:hypothetical protein